MLELYDGKLSRTVLRRESGRNARVLSDCGVAMNKMNFTVDAILLVVIPYHRKQLSGVITYEFTIDKLR